MLLGVARFVIPVAVAQESLQAIDDAARTGDERFVVWSGVIDGSSFRFRRAIVPRQTCHKTRDGLLVTIDGQTMFELSRDCYQHGELLAGQIHAHPREAYHSGADDELAIVAIPGSISVVVPDFARDGLAAVARWVCFQLQGDGRWTGLPSSVSVEIR